MSKIYLELYTREQANAELINKGELDAVEAGHISTTGTESNAAVLALLQKGGFDWKGTWLPDVTYRKNQVVQHDGNTWIGKTTGTGQEPALGSAYWDLFTGKGDKGDDGQVDIATDWKNLFGRNNVDVTVTSASPSLISVIEGATDRDTYVQVLNTCMIEVTEAGTIEGWYNLDQGAYAGILNRKFRYTLEPGWFTIDHSFIQRQIAGPADFFLDFYLQFTGSTGSATILARQCETTVVSAGIVGGASNKRPNFWVEDEILAVYDFVPAVTDSASVTLITPITLTSADSVVQAYDFVPTVDDTIGTEYSEHTYFDFAVDIVGTTATLSGGWPNYTYELLIDGGLVGFITTDATGTNVTDYGTVFSLSTGDHTIKVKQTGQTFTITVS